MDFRSSSVFVHVVTFNNARHIGICLNSILQQKGFDVGKNLKIHVTDNASVDSTPDIVEKDFAGSVVLCRQNANLGFCGGHNFGAAAFLAGDAEYLLIANPDLRLESDSLGLLIDALESDRSSGCAGPKLYRADEQLDPVDPPVLDTTGIVLSNSLRHFDRGSGERDCGKYDRERDVFGISGACMLLRRAFVREMLLSNDQFAEVPGRIFPALLADARDRAQLFDEVFFAYREDADLAWRAEGTGWSFSYVPEAVGYHVRVVLPERRRELDSSLNLHSVRNRFLLQINNYSFSKRPAAFLPGIVLRNLFVLLGVLFLERSSLPAIPQVFRAARRALHIRKQNTLRRERRCPDLEHRSETG